MIYSENNKGFTLTELLVAMAVFLVLVAFLYPTFSFIKSQSGYIEDMEALNERAQRVIDYMSEDIRMVGFVVGPKSDIPFCQTPSAGSGVAVLRHTDGDPYDTLTFITAKAVELVGSSTCISGQSGCDVDTQDYKLDICKSSSASNSINVDASSSCLDVPIEAASSLDQNARSLITFRTEIQLPEVYIVTAYNSKTITLNKDLVKTVEPGTPVFTLRQYEYNVSGRTLRRAFWRKDCTEYSIRIDEANGNRGGIDGLQFEYISVDPISGQTTTSTPPADLNDLKAVRIWLLVRSERPDRNYTDTASYTLGSTTGVTVGPFNDNYRRVLINKVVEVKNLAM